jgi:DNA sulfur modification protein DndC
MTTTQQPENKNQPNRTVPELIEDIQALTTEIQELYCLDQIPWIIGVSWGKDSSTVLQLVWNAIYSLSLNKRTKTIYVITTDTGVENPIVAAWVRKSINNIRLAAQEQNMPIEAHLLEPVVEDSFWVNLIGKGYPAPRNQFRWCTSRLKINPANQFIRQIVRANGETILVLGTRKAESSKRAATMNKHQVGRVRDRLSPNASLPNSLIYTPVEDWGNNDVWIYLNQYKNNGITLDGVYYSNENFTAMLPYSVNRLFLFNNDFIYKGKIDLIYGKLDFNYRDTEDKSIYIDPNNSSIT